MSQPDSAPVTAWHPVLRIAFRFAFVYLILFAFPGPIAQVPVVGDLIGFVSGSLRVFVVNGVCRSVLGLGGDLGQPSGSGDRAVDYVHAACTLVVAACVALLWSALARRSTNHTRLHEGLRIYLRYLLVIVMLGYGLAKVIPPTQFPPPGVERLHHPYGESSPMRLMWTFMGASQPYVYFAGVMELVAAALLLFRRTTTLGALVMSAVMANVVMLNFCYDVPVKLHSSHWLMMALFLLLPEVPRLMNVFVLHRVTQPASVGMPVTGKRWRIGWVVAKTAFVAWMLFSAVSTQIEIRKQF